VRLYYCGDFVNDKRKEKSGKERKKMGYLTVFKALFSLIISAMEKMLPESKGFHETSRLLQTLGSKTKQAMW